MWTAGAGLPAGGNDAGRIGERPGQARKSKVSPARSTLNREVSAAGRVEPRLFERVEDQPAEELGVEVGALGRHPLVLLADRLDVLDRGRHDQGGQREVLAGSPFADDV